MLVLYRRQCWNYFWLNIFYCPWIYIFIHLMMVNIGETWSCEIYIVFIYSYSWINIALCNHWALSTYDMLLTDIYTYIYIYTIYVYTSVKNTTKDITQLKILQNLKKQGQKKLLTFLKALWVVIRTMGYIFLNAKNVSLNSVM